MDDDVSGDQIVKEHRGRCGLQRSGAHRMDFNVDAERGPAGLFGLVDPLAQGRGGVSVCEEVKLQVVVQPGSARAVDEHPSFSAPVAAGQDEGGHVHAPAGFVKLTAAFCEEPVEFPRKRGVSSGKIFRARGLDVGRRHETFNMRGSGIAK